MSKCNYETKFDETVRKDIKEETWRFESPLKCSEGKGIQSGVNGTSLLPYEPWKHRAVHDVKMQHRDYEVAFPAVSQQFSPVVEACVFSSSHSVPSSAELFVATELFHLPLETEKVQEETVGVRAIAVSVPAESWFSDVCPRSPAPVRNQKLPCEQWNSPQGVFFSALWLAGQFCAANMADWGSFPSSLDLTGM